VAEAKNLRKKLDYLKSQLTDAVHSDETEESDLSEDEEEVK